MSQPSLDFTATAGPAFNQARDGARLGRQHERIRDLMLDGQARTLAEIEEETGYPQASISAQLRHLRKERFGSFDVRKRHRGDESSGLYEYFLPQVAAPTSGRANSPSLPAPTSSFSCPCGTKNVRACEKCGALDCFATGHGHVCGVFHG